MYKKLQFLLFFDAIPRARPRARALAHEGAFGWPHLLRRRQKALGSALGHLSATGKLRRPPSARPADTQYSI